MGRKDRARDRSRRAVEAHTPPLPPVEEISFEDVPLEKLQEQAARGDVYTETARLHGTDPLGMLPQEPRGRHAR